MRPILWRKFYDISCNNPHLTKKKNQRFIYFPKYAAYSLDVVYKTRKFITNRRSPK